MQTSKTEHVICEEGRFWRETSTRTEIEPGAAIAKAFASKENIILENVFSIPNYGECHLCIERATNQYWWTVPISFINMRCEFRPLVERDEKLLIPRFNCAKESKELLTLKWNIQCGGTQEYPRIRLVLQNAITYGIVKTLDQFLVAFDGRGAAYRMPIGNLYDTTRLCCGEYKSERTTHKENIEAALAQFEGSQWNSDLYDTMEENKTSNFFRFKSVEGQFVSQPIVGHWTDHCEKVSVAFMDKVVL